MSVMRASERLEMYSDEVKHDRAVRASERIHAYVSLENARESLAVFALELEEIAGAIVACDDDPELWTMLKDGLRSIIPRVEATLLDINDCRAEIASLGGSK